MYCKQLSNEEKGISIHFHPMEGDRKYVNDPHKFLEYLFFHSSLNKYKDMMLWSTKDTLFETSEYVFMLPDIVLERMVLKYELPAYTPEQRDAVLEDMKLFCPGHLLVMDRAEFIQGWWEDRSYDFPFKNSEYREQSKQANIFFGDIKRKIVFSSLVEDLLDKSVIKSESYQKLMKRFDRMVANDLGVIPFNDFSKFNKDGELRAWRDFFEKTMWQSQKLYFYRSKDNPLKGA